MVVKKIIHNAFEQMLETSKDMAKSSAKQVKETFNPWDMIRNSFEGTNPTSENQSSQLKSNELQAKGGKSTPLDFDKLHKSYADQDKNNIAMMKQRLFQLVKKDEEKMMMKKKQEIAEKERTIAQEEAEKRRREEEQRRRYMFSDAPEGKSGRGTALMGKKKKRKPTEPQPAETKPGGGKQ
ncbi:MAG: hypothetical protein V1922_00125 [bacterium]